MPAVITNEMVFAALPPRPPESHKGAYGRVLAVCGCPAYRGAAALSVLPLDHIRFAQQRHDFFQILERNFLPPGNLFHGRKRLAPMLGKIKEHADGIASSCGNHKSPSFSSGSNARRITPPPSTISPSYKTAYCPGVGARCGSSNISCTLPSSCTVTQTGCSGWR